jgi:uncharacterized protein with LGFP repeats
MIFVMTLIMVLQVSPARAVGAVGFQPDYIIDDIIFTNKDSASVNDIQSFLNSKVPSCDTNGQQLSEYGGPDLNGDGKVQRWEWGQANYNQTVFTCLKDYKIADGRTAAQLIYDTAQKYAINPQVFIVLLQKEQVLVTDAWPLALQYRSATGYGCPDGGAACDTAYYGLLNQLDWAGKMYRAILNQSPTWYSPYHVGINTIYWSPTHSCGTSQVDIKNLATVALYDYTPYRPNQAALDAGWGTGDGCSAYGNRNFYLYFTSWFGSTTISVNGVIATRYNQLGGQTGVLGKPLANEVSIGSNAKYQYFENGYILASGSGAWESMGPIRDRWAQLGYQTGKLGFPAGPLVTTADKATAWQAYDKGVIIWNTQTGAWESMGPIRDRWAQLGYQVGKMGYPTGQITTTADGKTAWQGYQNGVIIWNTQTGAWENKGSIRDRWAQLGYQVGKMGYPTGAEEYSATTGKWSQQFQNGYILAASGYGTWESMGPIRDRWIQLGGETGIMGLPIGQVTITADGKSGWQPYKNGFIVWNTQAGAWESKGGIRIFWAQTGYQAGKLGFPTGPEVFNTSTQSWTQTYEHGTITCVKNGATYATYL